MRAWASRPAEIANLLNPAFCGLILRNFVSGHQKQGAPDADPSLAFLVLPITLHTETRLALPSTIATKFHAWVEEHQPLQVGFAQRCRALVPFTREALTFACWHEVLSVNETGNLVATTTKKITAPKPATAEVTQSLDAAYFLGRWLHGAGSSANVYSLLGTRP